MGGLRRKFVVGSTAPRPPHLPTGRASVGRCAILDFVSEGSPRWCPRNGRHGARALDGHTSPGPYMTKMMFS